LTGKAPYRFESAFLQRGVCKPSVPILPRSAIGHDSPPPERKLAGPKKSEGSVAPILTSNLTFGSWDQTFAGARRLTARAGDGVIPTSMSRKGRALLNLAHRIGSLPRFRRGDAMSGGNPVERRLAAILIADVVGYSRLMGIDEVGTLRQLTAHRRECIDPV
jgi:hypothetical protein